MPRIKYEECPNCGDTKVAVTTDKKVLMVLHNFHIIHAPYGEYRVWVCHSCGWVATTRWQPANQLPLVYSMVRIALAPARRPETEVEPEPEVDVSMPNHYIE